MPISEPVAGVAIGMISRPDPENENEITEYKVLTDLLVSNSITNMLPYHALLSLDPVFSQAVFYPFHCCCSFTWIAV